jgi:ubiquinone/menaquinone biosynthesis C-methylase UbiE
VTTDQWAEWLRERRFGGDELRAQTLLEKLERTRDRVLDRARLAPGETLLDAGCGDGLIAFGALERGAAEVIFSDISAPLLEESRALAETAGVAGRCRFVRAPADDLAPIGDAWVDVVTTRSVLIYVEDKPRAFGEFFRVLRPGGRFSCFEPINRFGSCYRKKETFWGYPMNGLGELAAKINAVYEAIQPENDPMLDFDERDLIAHAEAAGFFPIRLELEEDIEPVEPVPWETFANTAGNPKIPTIAEAMERALTPEERKRVVAHLRPLVEEGRGVWRMASAYLLAEKPGR